MLESSVARSPERSGPDQIQRHGTPGKACSLAPRVRSGASSAAVLALSRWVACWRACTITWTGCCSCSGGPRPRYICLGPFGTCVSCGSVHAATPALLAKLPNSMALRTTSAVKSSTARSVLKLVAIASGGCTTAAPVLPRPAPSPPWRGVLRTNLPVGSASQPTASFRRCGDLSSAAGSRSDISRWAGFCPRYDGKYYTWTKKILPCSGIF